MRGYACLSGQHSTLGYMGVSVHWVGTQRWGIWVYLFIESALNVGVHGCTCSSSWHSTLGYMSVPVYWVGTRRWGTWVYLFIESALDAGVSGCCQNTEGVRFLKRPLSISSKRAFILKWDLGFNLFSLKLVVSVLLKNVKPSLFGRCESVHLNNRCFNI